jgi:hypothetical protein
VLLAVPVTLAVAGALALLFGGHTFINYDTAFALLWGDDLAHGRAPDLGLELAPTPHPLATAAGLVLEPGSAEVLVLVALAGCGVLVALLAREWFGWGAAVLAGLLFLTREPVLSFGLRAYVDLPYLALVLGALLVEVRRPRAGVPVLVLLALAGLLRPEAWLFSAAYVVWLREWRLLALAAAAPVLWALSDLALTGDPLHSLLGTQENAEELGRRTGPVDLVLYGPRRLGEVLREPVLVGAALGAWVAWRERARLPLAALVLALTAFAVLAVAGLPIITRYVLLPAALACVLCGAVVTWRPALGAVAVLLVAFAPGQWDRLDRLERSLGIQERILADLDALPAAAVTGCEPLGVTNRRPVPHLALRFGVRPGDVRVGEVAATYVGPRDRRVAEEFVFDPRDPVRELPPVPPGYERVAGNASWTVLSRC